MSKRKSSLNLTNLILLIASLVTAALAFVGLVCNFVTVKSSDSLWNIEAKSQWNLSEWFQNINDMEDFDKIGNWQFARVMLIIAAVLLVVMVVLLVLKFFLKNQILKWSTIGVGMATVACAVIFMVTAIAGCSVLSTKVLTTSVDYLPNVGVFLFSISAIVSAILTEVTVTRK